MELLEIKQAIKNGNFSLSELNELSGQVYMFNLSFFC